VLDQEAIPADVHPAAVGFGGVEVGGQTKAVAVFLRGSPSGHLCLTGLPLPAQLLADIRDLQIAGVDLHRAFGNIQRFQAVKARENVLGGDVETGWQPEDQAGIDRFAQLLPAAARAHDLELSGHGNGGALLDQDVQPGGGVELYALPVRIGQLHV